MRLHWTDNAFRDVDRLYDFLNRKSPAAAERVARLLLGAPNVLTTSPAIGARVENLERDNVRRLIVGAYEIRYQLVGETIHILRVFHTRENR
jgi:plasmid stabilization system protein ParE